MAEYINEDEKNFFINNIKIIMDDNADVLMKYMYLIFEDFNIKAFDEKYDVMMDCINENVKKMELYKNMLIKKIMIE